jgi:hypothetical protein
VVGTEATGDTPAGSGVLFGLSQLLQQQQQQRRLSTAAAAEAPAGPEESFSSSSSKQQQEQQKTEDQLCAEMVAVTLQTTQRGTTATAAAAAESGSLRGGGGNWVLGVGEEEQLVRQALRHLISPDGAGDSEAAKVSLCGKSLQYFESSRVNLSNCSRYSVNDQRCLYPPPSAHPRLQTCVPYLRFWVLTPAHSPVPLCVHSRSDQDLFCCVGAAHNPANAACE